MSFDPSAANDCATARTAGSAVQFVDTRHLLDALPGPAWVISCSSECDPGRNASCDSDRFPLPILQCNAAARALSGDTEFASLFPSGLIDDLLQRLRSPQPQIGFHAVLQGERAPRLFSAALLSASVPARRLVLAQPTTLFNVPAQLSFDELLDSAFDGLVILDSERRIVQISACFEQMFGYTIDELRGKTPEALVPPGLEHEFQKANEVLDRGGVHHLETRRLRRDGTLLEVRVSAQPIVSGRFRGGLVAIYRDLTEVNRNTRHRNLRLEATRILAGAATVAQAAKELLPLIAAELGWDVVRFWQGCADGLQCVHGHYEPGCYCGDFQTEGAECVLSAGRVGSDGRAMQLTDFHAVARCVGKPNCKMVNGSLAAFPIVDAQQQTLGVLELLSCHRPLPETGQHDLLEGVCAHLGQFITRCKAEQALAENEAKFRTLAETAPTAIFIHADGLIIYANAALESITGYSREEMLNHSVWQLFHPEEIEELKDRVRRRLRGEEVEKRWEARMVCKNGELRWIDYSAARITIDNRNAVLCAASDITDRRALELQLRQTQKMEAVGRLAGGIAHDFNNLLMVIGCCGELITLAQDLPQEVCKAAQEIIHSADRAAALTRQLLAFSRYQVLAPRIIDLNQVLAGTELLLGRALGDDIVLHFDLESGLGSILADSSQIEQVVMNLAVNARDAMPRGGELRIGTCTVSLDQATPMPDGSRARSYAVLTVTDTGIGMNQEIQQHIFEPFFSTKSAGKGTGLGLSTVYGIVKQSGGFVTVESQPQAGATFKVFFPIASAVPVPLAPAAAQEFAAQTRGTILLVEDEDEVRALLLISLSRDGHTVLEASGGVQALEISADYDGKIDLLMTDVVMQGMSGRELADRMVSIRPGIKVLYASGYNEDTVLQKGVVEGQVEFLQKPFLPTVLSLKVRQLLSS
jgi:PAS domain S-box-containing protein